MGDSSDSAPVELTAKILMTAAIVLFLVVVFVLVLHLYAKWFWGRVEEVPPPADAQQQNPSRRRGHRRRRRHFIFAAGAGDPAHKGLDAAVLRSIPAVVFGPGELGGGGLECAICLSELAEGEKARLLPKCNHGFHSDCIDMWFESHSTCPICRNPVGGDSSKSAETDVEEDTSSRAAELPEENAANVQSSESPNFPTNVLFWGNETQVSSRSAPCLEEAASSSSSALPSSIGAAAGTSGSCSTRAEGMLVIDIPRPAENSSSRYTEEEPKSPVTTRLRSLKRLLSRERRVNPCSSSSADVEQV